MKLTHLTEQKQEFLTDRDDIIRYVKNVLNYTDRWKITDDGVEFLDTVVLDKLPNDTLDIKISEAANIRLSNTNIKSLDNFPSTCGVLLIYDNTFSKLVIKTKSIFETRVAGNFKLKSIITYGNKLFIYDSAATRSQKLITDKIEFKNDNVEALECNNSSKIISFDQIVIPSKTLERLTVKYCNIKSFKDFDFVIKDRCDLELNMLDNYRYVDRVKAKYLRLEIFDNTDNLITLILNQSPKILLVCPDKNLSLIKIIDKFLSLKNRADHIMDCALELIDAGFEEAAEL